MAAPLEAIKCLEQGSISRAGNLALEERRQAVSVDLTIRFPTEKHMREFAIWLADGGGEQEFFQASKVGGAEHSIVRMQYHAENPGFATNDKRRYGPFLADRLIIAHRRGKHA